MVFERFGTPKWILSTSTHEPVEGKAEKAERMQERAKERKKEKKDETTASQRGQRTARLYFIFINTFKLVIVTMRWLFNLFMFRS